MELALCLLIMGATNIAIFMIGVSVRQKVDHGKEVKLPNPVESLKSHADEVAQKREQEALEKMLYNIDVYDGTGMGQKDIE
jgi:hypothetical protein